MGVIRWLLILVVLFVLIIFGVENMELVSLRFSMTNLFSYEAQMPLFVVVVISVFGGAAMAGLIGLADHLRLHSRLRKQKKSVEKLENEVKSLRNLPLEEEEEEGHRS
jgi:uncharacterized integral membrane protein